MERGSNAFGDFLRDSMDVKGLTLREVSRRSKIDASNLSKMERGMALPPQKRETLNRLARGLSLDPSERRQLVDLADQTNGLMPERIPKVRGNRAIPLLLRAIERKDLTRDQVEALSKLVEDENTFKGRVET